MISPLLARAIPAAILAASLALPAGAQSLSETERGEIETIVRDYLLANPEILHEMMQELETRQSAAQDETRRSALAENREALFQSEHAAVVGNPEGSVTLVEFFDYNCGFCKSAMDDLETLLESDDDLRVLIKEFPVLGQASLEAAQVSAAVNIVAPERYLDFHKALLGAQDPVGKAEAMEVAGTLGLDQAEIEAALQDAAVGDAIEESFRLADALGIQGTPTYIVGDEFVFGAQGAETLQEKIDATRNSR